MAAEKSEGGGSFLANPSALLALVTIAGGLWLVSQKLTSDRPVAPAGGSLQFPGDQNVEARLWEDPFKNVTVGNAGFIFGGDNPLAIDLSTLGRQIQQKSNSLFNSAKQVVVMPVMLAGGQYSEDQESRIRSRFAIVSALGEAGYVPDDAEHIGSLRIPWLTNQEMAEAKLRAKNSPIAMERFWALPPKGVDAKHRQEWPMGVPVTDESTYMEVRYEWYRPRAFSAGSAVDTKRPSVLVLWLDDSYFEDEPLLRLPLLVERLIDPYWLPPETPWPTVRLIGPRRSVTLRNMLPVWAPEPGEPSLWSTPSYKNLQLSAQKVLNRIDLFCATPSAMDEVLVQHPRDPDGSPRFSVGDKLTKEVGFKSFHNFAATDAQIAGEVIEELKLRGADLTNEKNHVVLISEWDTFYARMLSLTYDAELAVKQGKAATRAEYVDRFVGQKERSKWMPANFHSFVYLRGLDGQTIGRDAEEKKDDKEKGRAGKSSPTSIEELRHWSPDVNKAEGQAQFDYLARLGDRVEELQKTLKRDERAEIKAIGIVGSDVYDTLLILQAMRERFPEVLFFTTDLDVRFFHPREREWARNLIVASAYGLALHPDLQGTVAPFRDSTQTAQFTATLAAVSHNALSNLAKVPPRRFEVGNRTAVDLSVASSAFVPIQPDKDHPSPRWLHPLTARELDQANLNKGVSPFWWCVAGTLYWFQPMMASDLYLQQPDHDIRRPWWALLAVLLLLAGASKGWEWLQRLTWGGLEYARDALDYAEEDIGGPDGAEAVLRRLQTSSDPFARWVLENPRIKEIEQELKTFVAKAAKADLEAKASAELATQAKAAGPLDSEKERKEADAKARKKTDAEWEQEKIFTNLSATLVTLFNQFLQREKSAKLPKPMLRIPSEAGKLMTLAVSVLYRVPAFRRTIDHYEATRSLDAFLQDTPFPPRAGSEASADRMKKRVSLRTLVRQGWELVGREANQFCDLVLGDLKSPGSGIEVEPKDFEKAALQAAVAARESARGIFQLRCRWLGYFWLGVVGCGLVGLGMGWAMWYDTFERAGGEPFSLTSGTSAWPAQVLRLLVFALAICFCFGLSNKMDQAFLDLTRRFRFSLAPRDSTKATDRICAQSIWLGYRDDSLFRRRLRRICWVVFLYFILLCSIYLASGETILNPVRGAWVTRFNLGLLLASLFGFLLLAFLTVDAARLCRKFIEALSERPTLYPEGTRRYFSRQMGRIEDEYLDEWIDLQLIAELTEQVGRLVYYPAGLVLLLFLARNSWWDCWSWPISLIVVFAFNFILALASVVILQRAAKDAKRKAEQSLAAKVKKLQAKAAPSAAQNNATQAEEILKEIRGLERGAFVPFWENPVVGAVFLSSGGTTMLQVFIWFMGR